MGILLYVICCFSLVAFNIFSLSLIFISLITMCLWVFLLGFILCGTLCASWTWVFPFTKLRKVFGFNLFKYFLRPFLFLFSFWDPYNANIGAFNAVLEISETVFISFHSFFFILFCDSIFLLSVFQLTYSFFCLLFCYWFFWVSFSFQLWYCPSLVVCSLNILAPC